MNLIETLTTQTQSLKIQYLEKMAEYATYEFARIEKVASAPYPIWGEMVTDKNQYGCEGLRQRKAYRKACDARHQACNVVEKGSLAFCAKLEAMAIRHYEDSIVKLAGRIMAKGLNQAQLNVKTGHVGVNIETVLTDGIKSVRAFTIIASGPCVRPHYRYLIK